jgi:hypothetical protein
LTSSGLPWADSGRLRYRRLRMVCLRLYSLLGIAGYADLDGGFRAMGRSCSAQRHSEPPAAGPTGAAAPRAAAEAAWHNVTKPHRSQTYRDAGRERASGAAGRSTRQAGASTSRRHWPWTRMESRATSGLEEEYDRGAISGCRTSGAEQ